MHYVFGDYTLDTQQYELHRAGRPVKLRPKVFYVLAYLPSSPCPEGAALAGGTGRGRGAGEFSGG